MEILSCVPGGNYREYNGTSMATPLVAGAVSLYRSQRPAESQEMLFGNFIHSINQHIDLVGALNIVPNPELDIISCKLTDIIDGDGDGRPDAGETIELKVKVRNTWGQSDDVKVGIEFGEFEDQTTAAILTPEANIGSISAYATRENDINLKIKLAANINDGRDIVFKLKTWYGDHLGEKNQPITISVENGVELKGIISQNTTLSAKKQYIITEHIVIPEGITLTIKPGTKLKFMDNVRMTVTGNLYAVGKSDSLIYFTKKENSSGWGGIQIDGALQSEYSVFEFMNIWNSAIISPGYNSQKLKDCQIINNIGHSTLANICVENSNILYNNTATCTFLNAQNIKYNNIIENITGSERAAIGFYDFISKNDEKKGNNIFSNFNTPSGKERNILTYTSTFRIVKLDSIYYGTENENKINDAILDFPEGGSGVWFDISNKMSQPSALTHGIVWKVVVNGKDTQDEFEQMDPLGVGWQKFEVFFNRAMDPKFPPIVSIGMRYPYSQTVISEQGSWSSDSTIYTVYGTIGITTGDGINTIRITGAKDIDHFEIPIEDRRFKVIIDGAGSTSLAFQAYPGLKKVNLEWNNTDLQDGLGYNMYRMEQINESTLSTPILINNSLIIDTLYTDFSVTPNEKYFYYYKIVRTNLTETDSSKVVSAIPLSASKGDANGDLVVNVLDITTIVSYLLNNNPQPFITEAADLNSDGNINILDVVGVVNLVLGNKSALITSSEQVHLYMQNDTLFADSQVAVGGIQMDISGVSSADEIIRLKALEGFESGYSVKDNSLRLIYYSLSGKTVPAGQLIPLLRRPGRMPKGNGRFFRTS